MKGIREVVRSTSPTEISGGEQSKSNSSQSQPTDHSHQLRKRRSIPSVPFQLKEEVKVKAVPSVTSKSLEFPPPRGPLTLFRGSEVVADWDEYLAAYEGIQWVCPVDYFTHAPFAATWKSFARKGVKIELPHPQMEGRCPVNCIATVIEFAGYKALVKFERRGKGLDSFAWISYCSSIPKPLNYSTSKGILVLPVQGPELGKPAVDFKALTKEFSKEFFGEGAQTRRPTIPWDHGKLVRLELERHQTTYNLGHIVEVLDREDPSRNRLGTVVSIVGDRLLVRYMSGRGDGKSEEDISVSMKSDLVHPLGWSHTVGQNLKNYPRNEVTLPYLRRQHFPSYPSSIKIQNSNVFELRHPFKPHQIVSGYVHRKLSHGYFVASVNTNAREDVKYIFHVTSDYILPCGFSASHNLPLEVPLGQKPESFSWTEYCAWRRIAPLNLDLLPKKKPPHRFVKECKLEAALDVLLGDYFGPATVINVAGHLILVHFDGWPKTKHEHSQWMSAFSTDIYPAGWAEMVGHSFQCHAVPHSREDTYYIAK